MDNFLPYYEQELGILRRAAQQFGRQFPDIAAELLLSGGESGDPQVERLLQSAALLNARVAQQLDDGHVRFTSALLEMLESHYGRPLPSCSVAQVDFGQRDIATATATIVPRGTAMKALAAPDCRFRTAYDVTIAPVAIVEARFVPGIDVPAALGVPLQAGCELRIGLASTGAGLALRDCGVASLRVYVDGGGPLRAALLDAIFTRALCACVEAGKQWRMLPAPPCRAVGHDERDALLATDNASTSGLRLLTEYFAFPDKFDFFDIDITALLNGCPADARQAVLHLVLPDLRDTAVPRLLRALGAGHLRLGCTPIVNLFEEAPAPIRVTVPQRGCELTANGEDRDLYSIDAVRLQYRRNGSSVSVDLAPFHSLQRTQDQQYWLARTVETILGTEQTLSFVDADQAPLDIEEGYAHVRLTCTNGSAPMSIQRGRKDGDLTCEHAAGGYPIRMLRQPTQPGRAATQRGAHWKVIAALSPNYHRLTNDGLPELLATLRLHAPPNSAIARRQLAGIVGLAHHATAAWLTFAQGASYLHGVEIHVTVDEEAFGERSLHAFAQVLDRFFAYYVHSTSFTRLVILSAATGQERLRCAPRAGTVLPI